MTSNNKTLSMENMFSYPPMWLKSPKIEIAMLTLEDCNFFYVIVFWPPFFKYIKIHNP
jgi:hypothetical protein